MQTDRSMHTNNSSKWEKFKMKNSLLTFIIPNPAQPQN